MTSSLEILSKSIERQIENMKPLMEKAEMEITKYQVVDEEKCEIILGIRMTFKEKKAFMKFIGREG